jgi:uncharacterized coiled-coil protein SlyX
MPRTPITLAVGLALGTSLPAAADTLEERLARMEALVADLQERVEAQEDTIADQQRTITEQQTLIEGTPQHVKKLADELAAAEGEAPAEAWFRNVEIAGLVEVEAGYSDYGDGFVDEDSSDVVLATFELGIASQITPWVEAGASLLYEDDGETQLDVDTAFVTLANPDRSPLFVTAGQIYVPFGLYETNMVSDPLTLEVGETRESTLQVGFFQESFAGSVYLFNGDIDEDGDDELTSWGAEAGFGGPLGGGEVTAGIGYISNLGDADALQDPLKDNLGSSQTDHVSAWTAHAVGRFGALSLIAEYLAAADDFEDGALDFRGSGAEPSAWNLEAGYDLELGAMPATVALGIQGTDEAVGLGLPEQRILAAVSLGIYENTALSFEWAYDEDYDMGDGGSGNDGNVVTAQLAVEF